MQFCIKIGVIKQLSCKECFTVKITFETIDGCSNRGSGVGRGGTEFEAQTKERAKIFWWLNESSKIVKCKMGWAIKIIPAWHSCELEASIMLAGKIRICNKAIINLYFMKDIMD
jgi:hypothetical protein